MDGQLGFVGGVDVYVYAKQSGLLTVLITCSMGFATDAVQFKGYACHPLIYICISAQL